MAKRKSQPNGVIDTDIVWDAADDTYSHVDIKTWLDDFDAAIGALMADRTPLGTIVPWSFPDKTSPDTSSLSIPTGYVVCYGQTLTSSQHDFPSPFAGGSIVVPDYRNRVLIGADPTITFAEPRTPGSETVNPGIKSRQGGNTATVPDHYHYHKHIHAVGGIAAVETTQAGPDAGGDPYSVNTNASGSGYDLARLTHAHQLRDLYSSQARDPANPSALVPGSGTDGSALSRIMTTLQVQWDGSNGQTGAGNTGSPTITPGGGTVPSGSTTRDNLNVSAYQASEGVYFLMKVKWGSDYNRPWAIRNSTGSADTVGSA